MELRVNSLADLPRDAARRFGNKTALFSGGQAVSFAEVEQRVDAVAGGLSRLGIGARDRVVLHLPNTWEWIVAYYAIARLDAVIVPANILLVSDEIRFIAEDCGAVAIIAPAARIKSLRDAAGPTACRRYIAVGEAHCPGSTAWEDLLYGPPPSPSPLPLPGAANAAASATTAGGNAISTIGYTSGTTGRMKGATLSHRAVLLNTAMTANMHVRTAADIVVTALPCSHVYGNVVMNGAFLCGYSLVLLERFDADLTLQAIEGHRATMFEGVPTMYFYLLAARQLDQVDLTSLNRVTVGGQTMPLPQMREVQKRLGCPLLELWGMTEIAGLGTTHPAYAPERLGSIGRPLPFSECRVVDLSDADKAMSAGQPGELLFRGPTVMQGYYNQPRGTEDVMLPGGWLKTGDIAYQDADGYLFIVDRVKEMIITAGYNIYPSEVERVIAAHPDVHMVAVAGTPDAAKGELAHAYVVLKPSATLDAQTLVAYCRSHLAAYKVPKGIFFVSDLPKTSTGKIVRRALPSLSA